MGYTKIAGTPVITGLYTILHPDPRVRDLRLVAPPRRRAATRRRPRSCSRGSAALGIAGLQPYTSQWLALASLSALLAAGLLVLARLARLGFLANFISRTVLIGFLTGVGIQVAMGQFAGLLGVPEPSVVAGPHERRRSSSSGTR